MSDSAILHLLTFRPCSVKVPTIQVSSTRPEAPIFVLDLHLEMWTTRRVLNLGEDPGQLRNRAAFFRIRAKTLEMGVWFAYPSRRVSLSHYADRRLYAAPSGLVSR
jgi:hypothetical protein